MRLKSMKFYNIPIFVPHYGCPFDCVFCNQKRITGEGEKPSGERTEKIIKEYLETLPKSERVVEAAFFGGSFTAVEADLQEELLAAAYKFLESGDIDGIRLSTRPDYIDDEIMQRLMRYGVTTIELGVQSLDEEVLIKSGRGHTAADVERAVEIIRKYPVKLGLQMMTGLPGDTAEKSIKTAEEFVRLKPDCARIYPTLVIKDTELCDRYKRGEYSPQTLSGAVELAAQLIEILRDGGVEVIRVGLAATDEICEGGALEAGPCHSAFGELAEGEIFYNMIKKATIGKTGDVSILVNPADISKAIGNGKRNTKRLKNEGINLHFIQDESVLKGEIVRKD